MIENLRRWLESPVERTEIAIICIVTAALLLVTGWMIL